MTKVHVEAKKFASQGYTIVLIGHEGHEEVEGTMGEGALDSIVLIETEADVDEFEVDDPDRVAYLTQTTLSVDETDRIIRRLWERFPNITGLRTDDICYATTNRQLAVRRQGECDLVLVIGSRNSSNSNRLAGGGPRPWRRLVFDRQRAHRRRARRQARGGHQLGRERLEELVQRLVDYFRKRGTEEVSEFEVVQEDVRFMLPKEIRKELAARRELHAVEPHARRLPRRCRRSRRPPPPCQLRWERRRRRRPGSRSSPPPASTASIQSSPSSQSRTSPAARGRRGSAMSTVCGSSSTPGSSSPHRIQRLGERDSASVPRRHSWIASSESR